MSPCIVTFYRQPHHISHHSIHHFHQVSQSQSVDNETPATSPGHWLIHCSPRLHVSKMCFWTFLKSQLIFKKNLMNQNYKYKISRYNERRNSNLELHFLPCDVLCQKEFYCHISTYFLNCKYLLLNNNVRGSGSETSAVWWVQNEEATKDVRMTIEQNIGI